MAHHRPVFLLTALLVLLAAEQLHAQQVCADYTATGYYSGSPATLQPLTSDLARIPSTLSWCELAQLEADCVARINEYRAGTRSFSSGPPDPGVPKPTVALLAGRVRCSSAQAAGDLKLNLGLNTGLCSGAHTFSSACPSFGASSYGQNSCCRRTGSTYTAIQSTMYSCLQQMWDEGEGLADTAAFTQANGHWWNMRNSGYSYVSCGFGFSSAGAVWITQDFYNSKGTLSDTCPCTTVGASDGCGSTCVDPAGNGALGVGGPTGGSGSSGIFTPAAAGAIAAIVVVVAIALTVGVVLYVRKRKHAASTGGQMTAAARSKPAPASKPAVTVAAPAVPRTAAARPQPAPLNFAAPTNLSPRSQATANASKPAAARAPPPAVPQRSTGKAWSMYTDEHGNPYYFNHLTNQSTWERPAGF